MNFVIIFLPSKLDQSPDLVPPVPAKEKLEAYTVGEEITCFVSKVSLGNFAVACFTSQFPQGTFLSEVYKSKTTSMEQHCVFMLLPPVYSEEEDFERHHRPGCHRDSRAAGHDHRSKSKFIAFHMYIPRRLSLKRERK